MTSPRPTSPREERSEVQFFDPFAYRHERAKRGLCTECGKRPGSIKWGDGLAVTHGWTEQRCGVCVYGAQLRHAFARAVRIPILTSRFVIAVIRRA